MKFLKSVIILLFILIISCNEQPSELRINELQLIGTHNSYKQAMDSMLMAQLGIDNPKLANSLDYNHVSLTEQLQLGIRILEIDVFHDPLGGRYSDPIGIKMQQAVGLETKPVDIAVLNQPGFKVLHIQDIDFRSNCPTMTSCLQELNDWSLQNPGHLPVIISLNAKESPVKERPGFVVPLRFTSEAFDSLDAEITSVLGRQKIIVPDDVRGDFETLEGAVLAKKWPKLRDSRGKFIFILDAGIEQQNIYCDGHQSLKDRVMFTIAAPGKPEAAIIFQNQPIGNEEKISQLVKAGYIVRTRADASTTEARTGDFSRFESAKLSGAQLISTDYILADERFGTGYQISFDAGQLARCNPILHDEDCAIE